MPAPAVEVLLVHPAPDRLAALFASLPGVRLVHASTLAGALSLAPKTAATVAVVALDLPDSRGLSTLERVRAAWPEARIAVIVDEEALGTAALSQGAALFVATRACSEQAAREQLLRAVLELRTGVPDRARHAEVSRLGAGAETPASLAHDFNNLLQVILGAAEELEDAALPPTQAAAVEQILAAARRGMDLTRRLSATGRRGGAG